MKISHSLLSAASALALSVGAFAPVAAASGFGFGGYSGCNYCGGYRVPTATYNYTSQATGSVFGYASNGFVSGSAHTYAFTPYGGSTNSVSGFSSGPHAVLKLGVNSQATTVGVVPAYSSFNYGIAPFGFQQIGYFGRRW